MEVQRLVDITSRKYTHSYDMTFEEKKAFDIIYKQKINQAFDSLNFYLNLMKKEASKEFVYLERKQQVKILKLRIKQAQNYVLEIAGFYEYEFVRYMDAIKNEVERAYMPFISSSLEFNRWLRIEGGKKLLKKETI